MKKTILITICVGIVLIVVLAVVGSANTRNKEANSIVQVLNQRKTALNNSERTPGNASTLSITEYSAALKMIDVSGCPQKFGLAWKNYIEVVDSKKGLGILSGASGIREAENQLEEAAIDAGVKFDFSKNQ